MGTSAWGIEHGEVSKGLFKIPKLPGSALRAAKKEVRAQPAKVATAAPSGDFLKPKAPTPRGALPGLGNMGNTPRNVPMPKGSGRGEAGFLNRRRHVT